MWQQVAQSTDAHTSLLAPERIILVQVLQVALCKGRCCGMGGLLVDGRGMVVGALGSGAFREGRGGGDLGPGLDSMSPAFSSERGSKGLSLGKGLGGGSLVLLSLAMGRC